MKSPNEIFHKEINCFDKFGRFMCRAQKKKNGSGFEVDDKIGLKILTITNHNG